MTCVIKDNAKFYPQIFLEELLHNEQVLKKDRRRINAWCLKEDEKKDVELIFTEMC